jgi:hypothetical protein
MCINQNSSSAERLSFLIIDDEEHVLLLLGEELKEAFENARVDTSMEPLTAEKRIKETKYSLIIIDAIIREDRGHDLIKCWINDGLLDPAVTSILFMSDSYESGGTNFDILEGIEELKPFNYMHSAKMTFYVPMLFRIIRTLLKIENGVA